MSKLRDTADRLFSLAVRATGFCEECGSIEHLQCAHVHSRSYSATRVDFRNAVCLCRSCHMFFTHRPIEWEEWARKRLGDDVYDELARVAVAGAKVDWRLEVDRLKADAVDFRADPLRMFR